MFTKDLNKKLLAVVLGLTMIFVSFFCITQCEVRAEETPKSFTVSCVAENKLTFGDQKSTELCWDFATAKMYESYIYGKTGENYNFSESWVSIAYQYYVNHTADEQLELENDIDRKSYKYGETGLPERFQKVAVNYGLAKEDDCGFLTSVNDSEIDTLFNQYKSGAEKTKEVVESITTSSLYEHFAGKIEYENDVWNIVDLMKEYLRTNGTIYTAIVPTYQEINGYLVVNCSNTEKPNHALTIVGYDDEKQVLFNGESVQGAFELRNSYGTDDAAYSVWIAYDYYIPTGQIVGSTLQNDTNQVNANTYFLSGEVKPCSQQGDGDNASGNDSGGEGGTTSGEAANNDGSTENVDNNSTTNNSEVAKTGIAGLWQAFNDKFGDASIAILFAIIIFVVFLVLILLFAIFAIRRKRRTNALNKEVMRTSMVMYNNVRADVDQKKLELEEEIKANVESARRKQQKRLKRQFERKVENLQQEEKRD